MLLPSRLCGAVESAVAGGGLRMVHKVCTGEGFRVMDSYGLLGIVWLQLRLGMERAHAPYRESARLCLRCVTLRAATQAGHLHASAHDAQ